MTDANLRAAVATRFVALNGEHPMTAEDDTYVSEHFVSIEELAASSGIDASRLRRRILANRLPLPGYLRSDGAQMVARDLLELAERAGGVDNLPGWFASHFSEPVMAVEEWDAYLSGHYVCLWSVTPENIRRKGELVAAIESELSTAEPTSTDWLDRLHALVDELDELEPPFAPYDRLRFGGPVSRDRLIDEPRRQYPNTTR